MDGASSSLDVIKEASTQRIIPSETPLLGGESAIVEIVECRSKRRRTNHIMMMMKEEGSNRRTPFTDKKTFQQKRIIIMMIL
jgi:hypothetical protein